MMEALAPLLCGEGVALEDALPVLRTPRLYYGQARRQAGEGGGGGVEGAGEGGSAIWRQPASLSDMQCILRHAVTSEACRVGAAELEELQANFVAFGHIADQGQ